MTTLNDQEAANLSRLKSALAAPRPDALAELLAEAEARATPEARLKAWLSRLNPNTARAYARDLRHFAAHLGLASEGAALSAVCSMTRRAAIAVLESWRDAMVSSGLASATINRRLSAVNAGLHEIGMADVGHGRLPVRGVRLEARHDRRGPSMAKVAAAVELMAADQSALAIRDLAIVRLAAQRGLRRSEIAGLRLSDLALDRCEVYVLRKGKKERVAIGLAPACCAALCAWLAIRPEVSHDAVFVGLNGRHVGKPVTGSAIAGAVARAGREVGQHWRAHGMRHSAITHLLNSGVSLAAAQSFAGHASPSTTMRYCDDQRRLADSAVSALADAI